MRHHPYKLYGAALLAVIVGGVALTILIFNKTFSPATFVTVHVSRAALQLLPGSDVKVRGIVVGSVEDISSTGDGADLRLRLDPAKARTLPTNVTVRMLPKTLFGEKYVDLVLPADPAAGHLSAGTVIAEDQTKATLEIDQALNDLLPLLRTVPPVELNHTLTALATALSGRGEELGQTIDQLDAYLRRFNPQLPRLAHDMDSLAAVTATYSEAADPLLRMLHNFTVTSRTIVDQRQQLAAFLGDVTGAADQTRDLFARNAHDLVAVNSVNRRVIALLARYSPEYECFVTGYQKLIPRIHDAVPNTPGLTHSAHVVVEAVPAFPTYSYPIDLPQFKDKRGPHCYGLPDPPRRLPVFRYNDGTRDDPRFDGQGEKPAGGGSGGGGSAGGGSALGGLPVSPASYSPSMGRSGTREERTALDTILGPMLGIPSVSVPDIADLLWGPMARGAAVAMR
jgi:phospholipid/cholesterol/gamma-HCH transport system substrate-binding protein